MSFQKGKKRNQSQGGEHLKRVDIKEFKANRE